MVLRIHLPGPLPQVQSQWKVKEAMVNNHGQKEETSWELKKSRLIPRKTIWICILQRRSLEKFLREKTQGHRPPRIREIIPPAGCMPSHPEPENSLRVQKRSPKNLTQVIRGGETRPLSWQQVEISRKWAPRFLNLTMIFKKKPKSKIISQCLDNLWMKVLTRNLRRTMSRDIAFWAAKRTHTGLKSCPSFWLRTNLRETRIIKISVSMNRVSLTNILNYNSLSILSKFRPMDHLKQAKIFLWSCSGNLQTNWSDPLTRPNYAKISMKNQNTSSVNLMTTWGLSRKICWLFETKWFKRSQKRLHRLP